MPVEINLLSRHAKKDRRLVYMLAPLAAILLIGTGIMAWYGQQADETAAEYEREHQELEIKSAELQYNLQELKNADAAELGTMITFLEEEKVVPASALLHEVVQLMPGEGYMTLFDYEYPGDLYLEIAFYDLVELASYHRDLEDSAMIKQVTMQSVSGEELEEEAEEEGFWPDDYLPHYYSYFHITLNPDAIRAHGDDEEDDGTEEETL